MTFDYFIIKLAEQIEDNLQSHIDENVDKTYKDYKKYNKQLYSTMLFSISILVLCKYPYNFLQYTSHQFHLQWNI
jgi:hypothetical protein